MFDGMKLVDGISPLKRISLSVWCDARPRAEQERLPHGYDAPYGDIIAAKVARYPCRGQVSVCPLTPYRAPPPFPPRIKTRDMRSGNRGDYALGVSCTIGP